MSEEDVNMAYTGTLVIQSAVPTVADMCQLKEDTTVKSALSLVANTKHRRCIGHHDGHVKPSPPRRSTCWVC